MCVRPFVPGPARSQTRKHPVGTQLFRTLASTGQYTAVPVVMDKLKLDSLLTGTTDPSHEDLSAVAAFWQGRTTCTDQSSTFVGHLHIMSTRLREILVSQIHRVPARDVPTEDGRSGNDCRRASRSISEKQTQAGRDNPRYVFLSRCKTLGIRSVAGLMTSLPAVQTSRSLQAQK